MNARVVQPTYYTAWAFLVGCFFFLGFFFFFCGVLLNYLSCVGL